MITNECRAQVTKWLGPQPRLTLLHNRAVLADVAVSVRIDDEPPDRGLIVYRDDTCWLIIVPDQGEPPVIWHSPAEATPMVEAVLTRKNSTELWRGPLRLPCVTPGSQISPVLTAPWPRLGLTL